MAERGTREIFGRQQVIADENHRYELLLADVFKKSSCHSLQ